MMSWNGPRRLLLILLSLLIICSAWIPGVQLAAGPQLNDLGWTIASYSPYVKNYAVAVTGAGDAIYIANSASSGPPYPSHFWRYNPSDNTWDDLAVPSGLLWKPGKPYSGEGAFKNGTCLAWDNGNYVYTLFGASYADGDQGYYRHYFYRYSIPDNNWEQLENTPSSKKGQGPGDAITWVPGSVLGTETDWIYAVVGSKEGEHGTIFCRYNINDNSWEELPYNPSWSGEGSDDGSSLVWAGDNYLYALQGEWHETDESKDRAFARFDLTDNTWNNLLDIPEEGGVGDGGSLVWVGGTYSDNIYALGGGYVGPVETPGENFYCYSISGNSWTQLQNLPYGITDQNGPRLGYVNENIYCWRGYYNAGTGDPDVLWAYAVPETKTIGVSVSISPSENSDLPCENLTYTVTVTNVGALADNYDLTVSDNENWNPTLSENLLENIGPGENKTVTLIVKIPENAPPDTKDNILVVAVSQTDNTVTDSDTCIAHVLSSKAEFSLVTLYKVGLDAKLYLENGLKLVVKFYTYGDVFENENVFWSGTTPAHVEENENVPHPENIGAKKVRLDLTTDDTENVISTLSTFIVHKVDLEARFLEIPFYWSMALPGSQERLDLETEFMEIPFYWSGAPP